MLMFIRPQAFEYGVGGVFHDRIEGIIIHKIKECTCILLCRTFAAAAGLI